MNLTTQKSKAFAVNFRDTKFWSPNSFFSIGWKWSQEDIKPLSYALRRKSEEVNRKQNSFETLNLVTLHFDGTMESRNMRGKSNFKGKLFFAGAGDVIYSKIDVRNGAIGVVPANYSSVAVSAEYPVYEVYESLANAEYIKLLFRTSYFRQVINSMISGASGRKRVQPTQLEKIDVPLPSLEIQKQIVSAWQQAQVKATKAQERVTELEKQIALLVSESLGRNKNNSIRPKYFILQWRDIERWGVEISWNAKTQISDSSYPFRTIGELCKVGSGGTPSRERPNYFSGDILWVKTTEVRNEVIFDTEEKITELGLKNSSARIYPAGSLLVAMYGQGATRGRTAKLGVDAATNQACAVLSEFSQDIEPDYLWYYLMSEYDNLRLQASGNNQPNLNAAMITNYPVPVPPLDVQKEIVRRVEDGRSKIRQEQEAAAKVAEESESEVERMILGLSKP